MSGMTSVSPGWAWVVADNDDFDEAARAERNTMNRSWKVRSTRQYEGETFAILEVLRPTLLPFEEAHQMPAGTTWEQVKDLNPRTLGVWEQQDPSLIHEASEIAEAIRDKAEEIAPKIGAGFKWVAGAFAVGAVALVVYSLTRK